LDEGLVFAVFEDAADALGPGWELVAVDDPRGWQATTAMSTGATQIRLARTTICGNCGWQMTSVPAPHQRISGPDSLGLAAG
jgi:hypothetical protein